MQSPLVNGGPRWPIAVLRCVEAVAQEGAQQRWAPWLMPALAEVQGFQYHSLQSFDVSSELMSLWGGIAEHHPCAEVRDTRVSLDSLSKCSCKKWFSCFCPELPFSHRRQVSRLKQKLSLRRTRA